MDRTSKTAVASVALHLLVIAVLIHHRAAFIAPLRLPGTATGHNLTMTYLPGRAPVQASVADAKTPPKIATPSPLPAPTVAKLATPTPSPNTNSPSSAKPDSNVGADSLGSGDINIARLNYHPAPQPDLSGLPRGTAGNVIVDVVIDTDGKIADVKIASGLGHGIDESVMAIVQQWTFQPATKDGKPVASEQELLFHYERA
jgi:periplasmic protein TonB